MSESEQLKEINEKLGYLVMFAVSAEIEGLSQTEAIRKLMTMGFTTSTISDFTDLPRTTVAPIVSRLKKS